MRLRAALPGLIALSWTSTAAAADWETIFVEDGITVYAQEVAGRNLPTFRGEGVIAGSILDVLAVFADDKRHEEWMHLSRESSIVKRISELEAWVYSRTEAPWPVADRDVVLHAKLTYDVDKREAWNRFEKVETDLVPESEGVVRMPSLSGYYHLIAVDRDHTAIVYQVDADPGGMLPGWLAALATRRLPFNTIKRLRDQVVRTRGSYHEVIAHWIQKYNLPVGLAGTENPP